MLTTKEIREHHGDINPTHGAWRREFVKRAQLARRVGPFELKCWAQAKGPVEWEVRWAGASFGLDGGRCDTWEAAMAAAEACTKAHLLEALEEL